MIVKLVIDKDSQAYKKFGHKLHDFDLTIEDLARAWASIDGKREFFDEGKGKSLFEDETGHYAGYMIEAQEQVYRAISYALDRKKMLDKK